MVTKILIYTYCALCFCIPAARAQGKAFSKNFHVYIPAKTFTALSYTGKDSISNYSSRIITTPGFYIARFEVTNKDYRSFVYYVRDSIAHSLLGHIDAQTGLLDWTAAINWKDPLLSPILLPNEETFGRLQIDPQQILFSITVDEKSETVAVYPDTLVWIRDFNYSYNEPLVRAYFSQADYDNYPVVGITRIQAMAYCKWKTDRLNEFYRGKTKVIVRLPTHAEWEAAAYDTKDLVLLTSPRKVYNYNFGLINIGHGVNLKDYDDDGYFYTNPVKSFPAGPYGIYGMKGNVAEWTASAMEEVVNAEMVPEKLKTMFVVKGGGWNSTPFYLQSGACQFFPAAASHSYIGFRYVLTVEK